MKSMMRIAVAMVNHWLVDVKVVSLCVAVSLVFAVHCWARYANAIMLCRCLDGFFSANCSALLFLSAGSFFLAAVKLLSGLMHVRCVRSRCASSCAAAVLVMPSANCSSELTHFTFAPVQRSLSWGTRTSMAVLLSAPLEGWSSCFTSRSYRPFASVIRAAGWSVLQTLKSSRGCPQELPEG